MLKNIVTLPSPSPGTQRTLAVYRYGEPGARPKAYFQAAIHADETPALLVAHHLLQRLGQAEAEGRMLGEVVVVPVANPPGLSQHLNGYLLGRFDFGASGNFNRGFPELPDQSMLERLEEQLGSDSDANVALIRKALLEAVAERPMRKEMGALKKTLLGLSIDADLVLDLHCDSEAVLHLYAARQHGATALELGTELGVAVLLLEDNPGGGPFDDANAGPWWRLRERLGEERAIPLACFAATVELRGQADVADAYAEGDAAHLMRFLQRRGVLAGAPEPLPPVRCEPTPLEGVDVLVAPAAGVVVYRKALGDWVRAGEVVAEVLDPTDADPATARIPVPSRTDGMLFARQAGRLVRPGQSFCKVAGRVPLAHRQPGKLLED